MCIENYLIERKKRSKISTLRKRSIVRINEFVLWPFFFYGKLANTVWFWCVMNITLLELQIVNCNGPNMIGNDMVDCPTFWVMSDWCLTINSNVVFGWWVRRNNCIFDSLNLWCTSFLFVVVSFHFIPVLFHLSCLFWCTARDRNLYRFWCHMYHM